MTRQFPRYPIPSASSLRNRPAAQAVPTVLDENPPPGSVSSLYNSMDSPFLFLIFYSLVTFQTSIFHFLFFTFRLLVFRSGVGRFFRHIPYTPGTVLNFGFHAATIQARLLRERERGLLDVFPSSFVSSHVMTIEVPAGLRSWLCLIRSVFSVVLSFSSLVLYFLPFLFFR